MSSAFIDRFQISGIKGITEYTCTSNIDQLYSTIIVINKCIRMCYIFDYITIVRIYVLRQIDNISGYCADLAYIYGKLTIFLDIVPIFRHIFSNIVPIFRHIFFLNANFSD